MILPLQGTAASQLWSWDPRPGLLGASPTPGPGKLRSQPDAGIRVLGLPQVEGTVWNITDTPGGQALRRTQISAGAQPKQTSEDFVRCTYISVVRMDSHL